MAVERVAGHDEDMESLYRFVDVPTLIKGFIDAVRQRRKA